MKKKLILEILLIVGIIMLFTIIKKRNTTNINIIHNNVIKNEFSQTLDSYYSDDEDFEIEIYSAEPTKSALKTITLYNYINKKDAEILKLNEKENIFRFQVEKSIYLKSNCIDLSKLDDKSTLSDFYYAAYLSNYIKDNKSLKIIRNKYEKSNKKNISEKEKIYDEIIKYYLYGNITTKRRGIEKKLKEVSEEEVINIDYESLNRLIAYVQYAIISNDEDSINYMKKIYEKFTSYSNERYALFDMDAVFEDYIWIIRLIENKIGVSAPKDLFHSMYIKKIDADKGILYQISSPYNLACFVTALAYQNKDISDNVARNLKIIFQQLERNISSDNCRDEYYLKYVADFLNIDYIIPVKSADEVDNTYYSLLLYDKDVDIKEFTSDENSTLELLAGAYVCKKDDIVKKKLENIDIFSYKKEDEFGTLLNLYVCDLKKYDIITDEISKKIKAYIERNSGEFGYEVDGAYDFRTSVYYTNILYILNGGEDIGLR